MKKKVHFIGIGGSGISGVAMIAKSQGYEISGCDLNVNTPYIDEIRKDGVHIFEGQKESHVRDADIVTVTPAVYFQNENHPEVIMAQKEKKMMTWQKFLGEYLQKGKQVICIAGTHGKSTTTAMISLLLERVGRDPSVMVGANIKEWGRNYRVGKSNIFITEADEFFDNYLNYKPDVIILNNIEFDHPDYFKSEKEYFKSFQKFVMSLGGTKVLIYNKDDIGVKILLEMIGDNRLKNIHLFGYTTDEMNITFNENETDFDVDGVNFKLSVPGKYNVSNALGVISLGKFLKISIEDIKQSLFEFKGIGRRLELISDKNGVKIYDDYAHHPTAIRKTLSALRQKYPKANILAIVEPHTFSRTKALLPLYKNVFKDADEVIIMPIFKSRDNEDFGMSGESIVKIANHNKIKYINNFDEINSFVKKRKKINEVIIVMGAGNSYKLAYEIAEENKII